MAVFMLGFFYEGNKKKMFGKLCLTSKNSFHFAGTKNETFSKKLMIHDIYNKGLIRMKCFQKLNPFYQIDRVVYCLKKILMLSVFGLKS